MRTQSEARWHIDFTGRVQHVGFRYTALYLCRNLFLTGWVQNMPDGSVQVEIQGSTACLRKFLIQIKSQPHIHIEKAEIREMETDPAERRFSVR
jgi:acylphosphatase